jgi:hypothetical protein
MIGQKKLLDRIENEIAQDKFSRFAIMIGEKGSEKNEIGDFVARKLKANYVCVEDCKVDTIRNMISESYKIHTLTVYNIINADMMSVQAKNSLLKVTEEAPNKAYFIMTLEDENNTLQTIKSRGAVYKLKPYTSSELLNYARTEYNYSDEMCSVILKLCETPGDIDILHEYNPKDFYFYVEKVVDNIATTSGSNSFKIASAIAFKDDEFEKYDLKLFWRAFCNVCLDKKYLYGILITSRYMSQLKTRTVNKSMLFDRWILDIRQEWADGSK